MSQNSFKCQFVLLLLMQRFHIYSIQIDAVKWTDGRSDWIHSLFPVLGWYYPAWVNRHLCQRDGNLIECYWCLSLRLTPMREWQSIEGEHKSEWSEQKLMSCLVEPHHSIAVLRHIVLPLPAPNSNKSCFAIMLQLLLMINLVITYIFKICIHPQPQFTYDPII